MAHKLLIQQADPFALRAGNVVHVWPGYHTPAQPQYAVIGKLKRCWARVAIDNRYEGRVAIWASIHTLYTHHFYGA